MKHRLLILGTLGEFEQLVQKAREKGYYTIVCDGYPDGPARKFADRGISDPGNRYGTDRLSLPRKRDRSDGRILFRPSSGMYGKDRGPGRNPLLSETGTAPWYRDKSATRALLTELGLSTPGFRKIPIAYFKDRSKRTQLQELLEGLRYPVVSKPLDRYGLPRDLYIRRSGGADKRGRRNDRFLICRRFWWKNITMAMNSI